MSIKDNGRKKFLLLRKSKYFIFDDDIFKPLINLIKLKKKGKFHYTIHLISKQRHLNILKY